MLLFSIIENMIMNFKVEKLALPIIINVWYICSRTKCVFLKWNSNKDLNIYFFSNINTLFSY